MKTKLLALLLLTAFACSDDDESPVVANDEAAEMIATSLSSDAGGMTTAMEEVSVNTEANAGGRVAACGYSESLDISKESAVGAAVTYSYSYHYDYAIVCNQAIPTSMIVNADYSGSLDALRLSTENTGTANLSIEALDVSFSAFNVGGSFTRTGSFTSKVRNQNTSNSTITFVLTEVSLDKATHTITGGSATLTISGSVSGKGDFSYTGSIVFQGGGLAELTLNGTKYLINLQTGEVTAL